MKKSFFVPEQQKYIKLVDGYLNIYNENNEIASALISAGRPVLLNNGTVEKDIDSSQFLYQRYLKIELLLIYCLKEYENQHNISFGLDYANISKLLSYSPGFTHQKYYFKYPCFSKAECAIDPSEINFIDCARLKEELSEYNLCVRQLKKAITKHKNILGWKISLPQEAVFTSWKTIDLSVQDLLDCYKTLDFEQVGRGAVKFALDIGKEYFINGGIDIKELSKKEEAERFVVFVNNHFIPNNRLDLEKGLEPSISTAKTFSNLDLAEKTAIKYAYKGEYAIIKVQTKALQVCVNTLASTGDIKNVVSSIESKTEKKILAQELNFFDTTQELDKMKNLVSSYQSFLASKNIEDPFITANQGNSVSKRNKI